MDTDISDCDIEFTIEQSVYSEMPDILSCTAVNKAGTPFYCCFSIYIEKRFETVGDQLLDAAPVWVRIPFYSTPVWYESAKADLTWKVTVSNHLKEEFIFTPGQYRLLFIAEDGPHYAYFEITG